jgi:Spy/CpxP family protein refolding chaperone
MKKKALAAVLILAFSSGFALAVPGRGQVGPQNRNRLRERIGDLYILRLTRALDLTEEQTAKLYPFLTKAEKDKAEFQRRMALNLRELRSELARREPRDDALVALTNKVREARERIRRIDADVDASLDQALTPLQRARYVIFTVEFLRGLQEKLDRVRDLGPALKRTP